MFVSCLFLFIGTLRGSGRGVEVAMNVKCLLLMASFACRSGDTTAERQQGARHTATRLTRGHRAGRVHVERRAWNLSFPANVCT